MGHTTWEQVFSSRLAESANSTTISASARQEPKAFAAAGSEAPTQGRRDASASPPGRDPAVPPPTKAASEIPGCSSAVSQRSLVLTPQNSSVRTRLLGGSDDPLQGQGRQRTTGGHLCPRSSPLLSKPRYIFIWTMQFPPCSNSQENTSRLRIVRQLTSPPPFLSLYNPLSIHHVDRETFKALFKKPVLFYG